MKTRKRTNKYKSKKLIKAIVKGYNNAKKPPNKRRRPRKRSTDELQILKRTSNELQQCL